METAPTPSPDSEPPGFLSAVQPGRRAAVGHTADLPSHVSRPGACECKEPSPVGAVREPLRGSGRFSRSLGTWTYVSTFCRSDRLRPFCPPAPGRVGDSALGKAELRAFAFRSQVASDHNSWGEACLLGRRWHICRCRCQCFSLSALNGAVLVMYRPFSNCCKGCSARTPASFMAWQFCTPLKTSF